MKMRDGSHITIRGHKYSGDIPDEVLTKEQMNDLLKAGILIKTTTTKTDGTK